MADNLTLGRGELWFAPYLTGTTTPDGERYIGNSPEFSLTIENENLDHFNSDHGVNEKDDSIVLSTNRTGAFTSDNIGMENLALFFLGEAKTITTAAATGQTSIFTAAKAGLTYQLGTTDATPSGARKVSNVVITAMGVTTPTAGTDYTVDLDLGRLTILSGGALVGKDVTATFDIAASSHRQVTSGANAIEGSLRFISFNPKGDKIDYFMPKASITPNGDFALKGDEWQVLPFTIEVKKKGDLAAIYADGRPLATP